MSKHSFFPGKLGGLSKQKRHLYRRLRKFGLDESGALRLIGQLVSSGPNATFSISLINGNADVVAPYGAVLRAGSFSGFNVSEPAGDTNVYDPTQHRITFLWDFDDPTYTQRITPNIPTAWNDLNVAYGKQVAHVWHSPGTKVVSCFAFDMGGNWGTADYTFGPAGDAPQIADPNIFFSGSKTMVYSTLSNWTGEPLGATRCSTIADVHTAMRTRMNAGDNSLRVLIRAGEELVDQFFFDVSGFGAGYPGGTGYNYRDFMKGLHINVYGSGSAPVIRRNTDTTFAMFSFPDRSDTKQLVVSGFDFRGDWDAATETGRVEFVGSLQFAFPVTIITRCTFDGIEIPADKQGINNSMFWHDCRITNWNNYAFAAFGRAMPVILGCDVAHNVDALSGINQGVGGQGPTELGNRHGPFRTAVVRNTIVSCTSFLSRAGWSSGNPGSGNIFPPTVEQDIRCFTSFEDGDVPIVNAGRHHHNWERNSFEGGAGVGFGLTTNTAARQSAFWTRNLVIDKWLVVPGCNTQGSSVGLGMPGITMRNSFIFRHGVRIQSDGEPASEISISKQGPTSLVGLGPVEVYNNTIISLADSADLAAGFTPISTQPDIDILTVNNVLSVVSRSIDSPSPTAPLGVSPIAGFVCRHKGARWNFPPIIANVTAVREGGAGTVAVGEWVSLPYPTYTGNNGAGFTLTQALVNGQASKKHQVSVTTVAGKRMSDSTIWAKGNGRVTFDFTPTAIRIQNNSGTPWSSGDIWVLIDNSSRLMPFKAGTSIAGNLIPAAVPGVGSAARTTPNAVKSYDFFFGEIQNGNKNDSGVTVSRTDVIGAFAV
jgi:hypothetical protein